MSECTKKIQISIIVPVFNGMKYLDNIFQCLASQTDKDFEAIFIDDGSYDNTYNYLVDKTKNSIFKIVIIKQENQGVSVARNTGIKNAVGDYITFVDVDDLIKPNYIEYLKSLILIYNADVAMCSMTRTLVEGEIRETVSVYDTDTVLKKNLWGQLHIGVCGICVKRDLLQRKFMYFVAGYKYSEDLHMLWRILSEANTIVVSNMPLYVYLNNEGSAMSTFNECRFQSVQLIWQLEPYFYIRHNDFYKIYKKYAVARIYWALLRQASWRYTYKEFSRFYSQYKFGAYMWKLLFFRDYKVALSSIFCIVSPLIFYVIARKIVR